MVCADLYFSPVRGAASPGLKGCCWWCGTTKGSKGVRSCLFRIPTFPQGLDAFGGSELRPWQVENRFPDGGDQGSVDRFECTRLSCPPQPVGRQALRASYSGDGGAWRLA